jgi:hypothetical protein
MGYRPIALGTIVARFPGSGVSGYPSRVGRARGRPYGLVIRPSSIGVMHGSGLAAGDPHATGRNVFDDTGLIG